MCDIISAVEQFSAMERARLFPEGSRIIMATIVDVFSGNKELQNKLDRLTEERNAAEGKIIELTRERDDAKASADALTRERDDAKAAVASVTRERDDAKAAVDALTRERDDAKAAALAAEQRASEAAAGSDDSRLRLAQASLETAKNRVKELELQLKVEHDVSSAASGKCGVSMEIPMSLILEQQRLFYKSNAAAVKALDLLRMSTPAPENAMLILGF